MKIFVLVITLFFSAITLAGTIQSRIDGDSEGFDGDTIFKLTNGLSFAIEMNQ